MYVRWKRYERKRADGTTKALLCAQLVESVRTEKGPRQKVIAHLGSIDEAEIGDYWVRWQFWRGTRDMRFKVASALGQIVRSRFDPMHGIPDRYLNTPENVDSICALAVDTLAKVVPTPTAEERATARPPTDEERELEERDRADAEDEERRRRNREKANARRIAKDAGKTREQIERERDHAALMSVKP